jgi:uncharacterized membrane protein
MMNENLDRWFVIIQLLFHVSPFFNSNSSLSSTVLLLSFHYRFGLHHIMNPTKTETTEQPDHLQTPSNQNYKPNKHSYT